MTSATWIVAISLVAATLAAPLPTEPWTSAFTTDPSSPSATSPSSYLTASSAEAPVLIQPDLLTTDWSPSPNFTNLDAFSVTSYAAGATNIAILKGSPAPVPGATNATIASTGAGDELHTDPGSDPWESSSNSMQIFYPSGSINPGNSPQGGTEFYAHPLDLRAANNVTLEYSVYFPEDFDFVKGGKLPGLYGGHKGCSGGNAAVE